MDHFMPLKNPNNRCDDCIQHLGDWCCTMNCSNAEWTMFRPFGQAETVELRQCDDGRVRWHLSTRDGWQVCGLDDGILLALDVAHFAVGTKITLSEPITSADQPNKKDLENEI